MLLTSFGVLAGFIILLVAIGGSGLETLSSFAQPHALIIVFGGIIAASLISFRPNQLRGMAHGLRLIFRNDPHMDNEIAQLVKFTADYVRKDLRAAEQTIAATTSPFLKLGFQLVLDNTPLDDLMRVLEWRIRQMKEDESSISRCYRSLAGFAPAFGMVGTLAGLVSMLAAVQAENIEPIAQGMALALVATLYGVILCYLVFRPISLKLEQRTNRRVFMLHVLMDGLVLIRTGRGPAMVEDNLRHLMQENRDEVRGVD